MLRFRDGYSNIPAVDYVIAQCFEVCLQARNPQRRRPHVHAAALLSEVQRNSDNLNLLFPI
jgi:hypothetical protein